MEEPKPKLGGTMKKQAAKPAGPTLKKQFAPPQEEEEEKNAAPAHNSFAARAA